MDTLYDDDISYDSDIAYDGQFTFNGISVPLRAPKTLLITNSKPKMKVATTFAQINNPGISYNEAGITYNQSGVAYGGIYGVQEKFKSTVKIII